MSRVSRWILPLVLLSLGALAIASFGVSWDATLNRLLRIDLGSATALVLISLIQLWLLTERWRAWESRAGDPISRLDSMDAMSASLLIAMSFGPFAGDLARGVAPEGLRIRAIAADRLINTTLALAVAVLAYAPAWLGAVAGIALAVALLWTFGRVGVLATLLTLTVFVTIGLQIAFAARATGVSITPEALAFGVPALLIASLIPVSLLGFGGKEVGLPLVYGALAPEAALAMATVLAASSLVGPAGWYFVRIGLALPLRRQTRSAGEVC